MFFVGNDDDVGLRCDRVMCDVMCEVLNDMVKIIEVDDGCDGDVMLGKVCMRYEEMKEL